MLNIAIHIFQHLISPTFLSYTYIIPICYPTILQYNRAVGPTLCCLKCLVKWSFICESRIIIENDFISEFEVMVYYFIIILGVIFINLRLLSLTY